jgi:glycine cleavage system H protein
MAGWVVSLAYVLPSPDVSQVAAHQKSKEVEQMQIEGYDFPDDLLYDKDHNWVRMEGNTATIGLSDFGQDLAGEIVYAEVPRVGRDIKQGKWVGRINAIVSGTVIEVNEGVKRESTVINEDPYGEGWIAKVTVAGELSGLLKASDPAFARLIADEKKRYGK